MPATTEGVDSPTDEQTTNAFRKHAAQTRRLLWFTRGWSKDLAEVYKGLAPSLPPSLSQRTMMRGPSKWVGEIFASLPGRPHKK